MRHLFYYCFNWLQCMIVSQNLTDAAILHFDVALNCCAELASINTFKQMWCIGFVISCPSWNFTKISGSFFKSCVECYTFVTYWESIYVSMCLNLPFENILNSLLKKGGFGVNGINSIMWHWDIFLVHSISYFQS